VIDLASRYPKVAAELACDENGGTKPENIATSDRTDYYWQCPADARHIYSASPSNKVYNASGCPTCPNRLVVPGINDVAPTHPEAAADWHPVDLESYPPTEFSAGSKKWI
jgi:hypothetical protein